MKIQEFFSFLIGIVGGYMLFTLLSQNMWSSDSFKTYNNHKQFSSKNLSKKIGLTEKYEHELADKLYSEVKVLCWVFTHPENHRTKVPHVRKTWGKRCNKLLFMSVEEVEGEPDIIALPVENGRAHLWNKTRLAMKYVYDNYINDYDWFMRADDDNFILMENLRYMLYQYHPQTSLYMGCRFAIKFPGAEDGYNAGGGHIFSRKALKKFIEISLVDTEKCIPQDSQFDDVYVGRCLKGLALYVDGQDEIGQKRFFPLSVKVHFDPEISPNDWYSSYLWNNVTQGDLACCSDTFVESHYASPIEMDFLELLIYHIHPFGLRKNLTETLPRKFALKEIVSNSDKKSFARNYRKHPITHQFDDDERYLMR